MHVLLEEHLSETNKNQQTLYMVKKNRTTQNSKTPYFKLNVIACFLAISIVMLLVSFLAAEMIYASNKVIPYYVILISCFLLLELLLFVFVSPLAQIGEVLDRKKANSNMDKVIDSDMTTEEQDDEKPETEQVQFVQYAKRAEEVRAETEAERLQKKTDIMNYVSYVMPAILKEEDMDVFCIEIKSWLDNPGYNPIGRNWKWREDARFKVKHLDVRHLIWNIAIRMGMSDGYNTMVCALFLKKMFPDLCKDVKDTTLSQCLKADPNKGNITIDEPDDNSYAFHYDKEEDE